MDVIEILLEIVKFGVSSHGLMGLSTLVIKTCRKFWIPYMLELTSLDLPLEFILCLLQS